eukprot:TRINITY_DN6889_c0_g1_i1.p1 TRINITY_DN6889_c0_g1~~TRINITY_DN6889_c0_g1_i1.p1  ORF type:complete len:634 (+),score=62.09 TRINITY_DN6889_c0_g1_i1:80-1981(+)
MKSIGRRKNDLWLLAKFGSWIIFLLVLTFVAKLGPSFTDRSTLSGGSRSLLDVDDESCSNISDITSHSFPDACLLASKCPPSGIVNYLSIYFCTTDVVMRYVKLVCMAFLLLALFYVLGITTENYFCPTLTVMSKKMHLPADIAGITLLALGNGAPDVFSMIAGMNNDNFDIALGESLGSGVFCTTAIIGIVSVISTAKLEKWPVIRDIIFYLVALLMIMFICNDGQVTWWESVIFLSYYIVYVLLSVLVHIFRRKNKKEVKKKKTKKPKALNINETSPLISPSSSESTTPRCESEAAPLLPGFLHGQPLGSLDRVFFAKVGIYDQHHVHPVQHQHVDPATSDYYHIQLSAHFKDKPSIISTSWEKFLIISKWGKKKTYQKMLNVLFFPVRTVLFFTIPAVKNKNWVRLVGALYPTFSTLTIFFGIGGYSYEARGYPVWAIAVAGAAVLSIIVWFTTDDKLPRYQIIFILVAFVVSIIWIYMVANEIVSLLQDFGAVFGISSAILGIFLAWGNSVSDTVADIVVARKGLPAMAVAACFAGPLFNVLIGIGISVLIKTVATYPVPLAVDVSLKMYCAFLFLGISLLSSLIVIPVCKFTVPKVYGIILLLVNVLFGVCVVLIEILKIHWVVPQFF